MTCYEKLGCYWLQNSPGQFKYSTHTSLMLTLTVPLLSLSSVLKAPAYTHQCL